MNQSWVIYTEVLWPPPKDNFTERTDTQLINPNWDFENCTFKIPATLPEVKELMPTDQILIISQAVNVCFDFRAYFLL